MSQGPLTLAQRHCPDDPRTRAILEAPVRVVMTGAANPMEDAAAERRKATFSSDELAAFLHDGEDKLQRRSVAWCRLCGAEWLNARAAGAAV